GTPVRIEPKVLDLILHLIDARDRVVSKDELVEVVWQGRIISDAAISSAVSAARRALGDDGHEQRYIRTAHGRGFRFVGALVEIDDGGSPPALDIDLLRTFALVAENESVAQTAELVGRPQASVSAQVERLESLVGRRLLDRGSGSLVQLTPEGRSLLRPARELLSMSDGIVASVRARPQADETGAEGSERQRADPSETRGSPWERPSLAVLPFRNMSDDPCQEYFSDGMVEDIVAALSRISWLRVTAHSSGFAYKNRAVDPRQAGRELGVRYLLQGGVRRSGSRVRITAHLLDAESGTHLWSDRYDSSLEDVFDLQDHIADRVAAVVEPSLRRSEIERSRRKPTESLGAYDLYLRALPHIAARMPDEARKALPLLRQALELDPDYIAAQALTAWCHELCFTRGGFDESDRSAALMHARAIIASDTDDGTALAISGFVMTLLTTESDAALHAIERGISLNPASATAHFLAAQGNGLAGRPEPAKLHAQRALLLSPYDTLAFEAHLALGEAALVEGRYDDAVSSFAAAARSKPDFSTAHFFQAIALILAGRPELAARRAAQGFQLEPGFRSRMFHELGLPEPLSERFTDGARLLGLPE
uniref:LysR family transcriptional regulator n=1 Tax=Amaricoccus sp. TaxID=1872485 RepID=UPI002C465AA0